MRHGGSSGRAALGRPVPYWSRPRQVGGSGGSGGRFASSRRPPARLSAVTLPQPGIFAQGTRSHYHLEFDLLAGASHATRLAALAALREPRRPRAASTSWSGFGPAIWAAGRTRRAAAGAADFEPIEGPTASPAGHAARRLGVDPRDRRRRRARRAARPWRAVAAWPRSPTSGRASSTSTAATSPASSTAPRTRRSRRRPRSRSCPTANRAPAGVGARAALGPRPRRVPRARRRRAGAGPSGAPSPTASSSTTTPSRPTAHISRVVIEERRRGARDLPPQHPVRAGGGARALVPGVQRRPGRAAAKMLHRMFGTDDGLHDHLTDFSTPVSGAFYFAPQLDALEGLLAARRRRLTVAVSRQARSGSRRPGGWR